MARSDRRWMARSIRKEFQNPNPTPNGSAAGGEGGGNDEELRNSAIEAVKKKNDQDFLRLTDMQGREIKHLQGERAWLEKERMRDRSAINEKQIAGINLRYDRREHDLSLKHNNFWGRLHRVFGGHKHQQKQLKALTAERDKVVGERTAQHVRSEALRQRALTERDLRVEKDLQEAQERHAQDRDQFRQQREQSFDLAVRQEVNRLRHVQRPRQGM